MGIAYADLPSPEAAEEFINKIDGAPFKERKLRARPHVPFVPDATKKVGPKSPSFYALSKQVPGHKNPKVDKDEPKASKEQEFSTNSIFVKGLKAKTNESDLQKFFNDYNPTEIKIQKLRGWIRGFKNRGYNAVVTLDLPPEKSIDAVIEESNSRKHEWLFLSLMRAYAIKEKKIEVGNGENDSRIAASDVRDSANSEEYLEKAEEPVAAPDSEGSKRKPEGCSQEAGENPKVAPSEEATHRLVEKSAEAESAPSDQPQHDSAPLEEIKSSAENVVISNSSDVNASEKN